MSIFPRITEMPKHLVDNKLKAKQNLYKKDLMDQIKAKEKTVKMDKVNEREDWERNMRGKEGEDKGKERVTSMKMREL